MTNLTPSVLSQIDRHLARVSPACPVASVKWLVTGGLYNRLAEHLGINAAYSAVRDAVVIPEYLLPMAGDVMMAPTWAHELTHAAQCHRLGLIGYLAAKTAMRRKLEAEAVAEERRAQTLLGVSVL